MRNLAMALKLDQLAEDCDREAERAERAGSPAAARASAERAEAARRAAAILRAGPAGVKELFAA
jgi:hypothetical protein